MLHDLASSVAAPGVLLASADGQVRPGGVSGWYVGDHRLLDSVELLVDGSSLDVVRSVTSGADRHEVSYVARALGDQIADPTVRLDRVRELGADSFEESLVVESVAQLPVDLVVRIALGTDRTSMAEVRRGRAGPRVPAEATPAGLRWPGVEVTGEPAPGVDAGSGSLTWRLRLERGDRTTIRLHGRTDVRWPFAAGRPVPWTAAVDAADPLVRRTARQGLADLEGLLLSDEGDRFVAGGSPWFVTLFGRDSLWSARLLVPFDSGLALSTLRVLARRQGTRDDDTTEEQPGKILHEVRSTDSGPLVRGLPPLYYGTVDATPLFVAALADAAEWGADPAQVRALLPAARRCLAWLMRQSADSGWIRYVDNTGHGLANQGWKDSHDSVQFADGRLAEPPIALCEVQAYAYEAAVRGAALLAEHGADPVPGLAAWAADLRARFAREFWVDSPEGGHVAIALDRDGAPVDSVTSNMGHVLGTGLLGEAATERVARLLADPRMDSGFGLRTLASDSPRYSRLSYHGGAVWPHDTAIAVRGLAAEGRLDEAGRLAGGLFRAAEGFGYRLPELYGGDAAADVALPSAYPAACRPQGWAAAASLAVLVAVSGVRPDLEAGVVRHPRRTSSVLGAFTLRGLRVGTEQLEVHVDHDGLVRVEVTGATLTTEAVGDE
jgi:hypothetical protein